jgi:hypothetical protein
MLIILTRQITAAFRENGGRREGGPHVLLCLNHLMSRSRNPNDFQPTTMDYQKEKLNIDFEIALTSNQIRQLVLRMYINCSQRPCLSR